MFCFIYCSKEYCFFKCSGSRLMKLEGPEVIRGSLLSMTYCQFQQGVSTS